MAEHNQDCFQMGYFTWHHDPWRCGCECHSAEYRAAWDDTPLEGSNR